MARKIAAHEKCNGKKAAAVANKHLRDASDSLVEEIHMLKHVPGGANKSMIGLQRSEVANSSTFDSRF